MSANAQATTLARAPGSGNRVRWLLVAAALAVGILGGLVLGRVIGIGSPDVATVKAPGAVTQVQSAAANSVAAPTAFGPATGQTGSVGQDQPIGWSAKCSAARRVVRC